MNKLLLNYLEDVNQLDEDERAKPPLDLSGVAPRIIYYAMVSSFAITTLWFIAQEIAMKLRF